MSDGMGPSRERTEAALSARVDRLLDRELSAEQCAALYEDLKAAPSQARRLAETQAALDLLRQPVETPDLTAGILEEVDRRRGWLSNRLQRFVTVGRLAAAACLLLALTVVLTAKRAAPDAAIFHAGPAPVSDLISASQSETRDGVQQWSKGVSRCRAFVFAHTASKPGEADVHRFSSRGEVFLSTSGWLAVTPTKEGCDDRRLVRRACTSSQASGQRFRVVFSMPSESSALMKVNGGRIARSSQPDGFSDDEAGPVGGW